MIDMGEGARVVERRRLVDEGKANGIFMSIQYLSSVPAVVDTDWPVAREYTDDELGAIPSTWDW